MSAHEITRIANELAAKGLTPTTAMIKARLTQPVAMAELLKVLSQWKQQPATEHANVAAHEQPPHTGPAQPAALTLQQLSEQLTRLEQKVDRLTDLLNRQGVN